MALDSKRDNIFIFDKMYTTLLQRQSSTHVLKRGMLWCAFFECTPIPSTATEKLKELSNNMQGPLNNTLTIIPPGGSRLHLQEDTSTIKQHFFNLFQ